MYSDIIQEVEKLIDIYKKKPNLELEGCIGVIKTDKFHTGVDFTHFRNLLTCLSQSNCWSSVSEIQNTATFSYTDNTRARYSIVKDPEFVKKRVLYKLDLKSKNRQYDIRITLSEEIPTIKPDLSLKSYHTRLQKRWSFLYKGVWRYDCSKVAEGKDKEDACLNSPKFELEIEVLRDIFKKDLTNFQISNHIVHKLIDLLGRYNKNNTEDFIELKI